jgi:hypothetical protein
MGRRNAHSTRADLEAGPDLQRLDDSTADDQPRQSAIEIDQQQISLSTQLDPSLQATTRSSLAQQCQRQLDAGIQAAHPRAPETRQHIPRPVALQKSAFDPQDRRADLHDVVRQNESKRPIGHF